jgi:aminodeoxyfutalosine deaminase
MSAGPSEDFAATAPKAEIHLHLEGSIDLDALLELRASHGESADAGTRRRLAALYRHQSFTDFLSHFRDVCAELRQPEDFALVTSRLAERLRRDNVRHAEVMCSVGIFARRGLPAADILDAVVSAAAAASGSGGPRIRFLLDGVRQWGPDGLAELVELAGGRERPALIGVGMGGDESSWPASDFRPVYDEARRRGLRTTVHAGEAAGPRSVWEAIEVLGVERVGHGIRAAEDRELVRALARQRIPLECCPTSNLSTGVVKSWDAHPLGLLHRAGVAVTVNTDDPAMFGTTLTDEWRILSRHLGLSSSEAAQVGRRTIEAAFLEEAERRELLAAFDAAAADAARGSS